MKKILFFVLSLLLLGLTACVNPDDNLHKIPNKDDFDEVQLSLLEKMELFEDLDFNGLNNGSYSFDQYFKGNIDFSMINSYETNEYYNNNYDEEVNVDLLFDYESTLFVDITEELDDFILYGNLNKFLVEGNIYNRSDDDGEIYIEEININLSIDNSFFLILNNNAYFRLNGELSYGEEEAMVFEDTKQKLENIFEVESYDLFYAMYEEVISSFTDFEIDFDEADIEDIEELNFLNELIKVYKKDKTYLIEFELGKDKFVELFELLFYSIIGGFDPNLNNEVVDMMDTIIESIKDFNLLFKIVVVNNKLSMISLDFELNIDELAISNYYSDEYETSSFELLLSLTIEKMGFVIDLNAKKPTLPSMEELYSYETTEFPFEGLF